MTQPGGLAAENVSLSNFFGSKTVGQIGPALCQEYVKWDCAQRDKRAKRSIGSKIALSTAKRELVTLSAALNYCFRDKKLHRPVTIEMPRIADE